MTPSPPPAITQQAPGPTLKAIELFDAAGGAHYFAVGVACPSLSTSNVEQVPSNRITAIVSCAGPGITPEIIDEPTPTPVPTASPVHNKR